MQLTEKMKIEFIANLSEFLRPSCWEGDSQLHLGIVDCLEENTQKRVVQDIYHKGIC